MGRSITGRSLAVAVRLGIPNMNYTVFVDDNFHYADEDERYKLGAFDTLDEAIAFATGLTLDQLPEENRWTTSRPYFLRDLFLDKVFKEAGLVTRAANTVKLLRTRRLAVLSVGSMAALLLLSGAGKSMNVSPNTPRIPAFFVSSATASSK